MEWIGTGAFSNVTFKEQHVVLPKSILHIGECAFINEYYGDRLERPRTFKIPSSLQYIGRNAFERGSLIDLSDYSSPEIPYESFGGTMYPSSSSAVFPVNPFYIPESVHLIDGRSGITGLFPNSTRSSAKITLGSNVESIQPFSFILKPDQDGKCHIYSLSATPPRIWDESFIRLPDKDFEVKVHVPRNSRNAYYESEWKNVGQIIDDIDYLDVEYEAFTFTLNRADKTAKLIHADTTADNLFSDSRTLRIPSEVEYDGESYVVTAIGKWAFVAGYRGWNNIILPENMEYIESFAFPFSFYYQATYPRAVICMSSVPPVIEAECAFTWPYAPSNLEREKCGDLYVPEDALDAYKENQQFNSLFRVHPLSDFQTGITPVESSDKEDVTPMDIFTIDGLMVQKDAKDLSSLSKGLYIIRQREKSRKIRL